MAIRSQSTGLDFQKLGNVKDALHNPLTTAQRDTLAASLGSTHKGLGVYVTDLGSGAMQYWNGTAFASPSATQTGLTPKGNSTFNAAEPSSPVVGDLYVFSSAGSNTWEGTTVVQIGDQVYWDGTAWQFIQGNAVQGTSAIQGLLQLATDAETITGTDTAKATTPANVAAREASRKLARVYFVASITTVADTPYTVTHSLALQNRDAFVLSFKVGNSEEEVDVDSIDINSLSITTGIAKTGSVTVIGF